MKYDGCHMVVYIRKIFFRSVTFSVQRSEGAQVLQPFQITRWRALRHKISYRTARLAIAKDGTVDPFSYLRVTISEGDSAGSIVV